MVIDTDGTHLQTILHALGDPLTAATPADKSDGTNTIVITKTTAAGSAPDALTPQHTTRS